MGLFRKIIRERFEEKLRKNDGCRSFKMYERGRDVKTFEGTKEQLEEKLGKPVRIIQVEGDFIEHIYPKFEFIGRLRVDYLIEHQISRYKKEEPVYKGKPAVVAD